MFTRLHLIHMIDERVTLTSPDRKATSASPSILIVDDDREYIRDLLKMWHPPARVNIAHSGEEVKNFLMHHRSPNLVLLDIDLPHYFANVDGEEGFAILNYMKTKISPALPVFIVSQLNSPETIERTDLLHADRYFTKPVDISELELAVSHALNITGREMIENDA